MEPRIERLKEKKLIVKRKRMSLTDNKTGELWQSFMTKRKEIRNCIGTELYSIQNYPPTYFHQFNPATEFEKFAGSEVADFDHIPEEMETLVIPEGLYAVFIHKGGPSKGTQTFQYIFGTWLPQSAYSLDNRPHFELLGEKYNNDDPSSEEEIWIPIQPNV